MSPWSVRFGHLIKGGGLHFEGEFHRLNIPAFARPRAAQDRILVYLAAVQKGILQTTGEVAEGLAGHPLHSRKYINEFVKPTECLLIA